MNRVLHIGVMLAVVVHMTFGCCSHHTHASVGPSGIDASACESHHGHEHGPAPCSDDGPAPCGDNGRPHGCQMGQCTFARPDDTGSGNLSVHLDCLSQALPLPPATTSGELVTSAPAPGRPSSAVRLHLLNQVLLI